MLDEGQKRDVLLKASNEAIFITGNLRIVACNEFAEELFGYTEKDLLGKSALQLFTQDMSEKVAGFLLNARTDSMEAMALTQAQGLFYAQLQTKSLDVNDAILTSFTVRDISLTKQHVREIIAKDALLGSVSYVAARFLETKNWRNEIDEVLRNIGEAAKVSRVYIFKNHTDVKGKLYMSQKYEWVLGEVDAQITNPVLAELYYEENGLNRLVELMPRGEVIQGPVKDLPSGEREVLEAQDIKSVFLTPVFQNGTWWGFIGYDECSFERIWHVDEIQLLETVADIFTSVLDREFMELELTKINENFKSLFNNSPDGIFVYDYQGHILDVNEEACRLNGLDKNHFVGKHIADLVPDEHKASVVGEFVKWTTGEYESIETEAQNRDGRIIPVEISGTRIHYFDTPAVLLLVRDISSRKEAEKLLAKRIQFIEFISEISSDFIKIDLSNIDKALNNALTFVCEFTGVDNGCIFQINEAQSKMHLTNKYIGSTYMPYPDSFESLNLDQQAAFLQILKNGDYLISHSDEMGDNEKNTNPFHLANLSSIKSSIVVPLMVGERFLGCIGFNTTTDKTQWDPETIKAFMLSAQIIANTIIRKKNEDDIIEAKDKAEQSDRLKTVFLGQMSHEMRTPLNSIIGFAEILEKELLNTDLHEMTEYILSGGERLLSTFNLIIDLSEMEANLMRAKVEEVDLSSFVNNLMPIFSRRALAKQLRLEVFMKQPEIIIRADVGMFEKIIFNLVDNALKYTRYGTITLTADIEKNDKTDFALLKVKDSGIGIAADKLNDVFSKFRQASEGYNREFEGSGLGLSVTKGMVELMGGEIFVISEIDKGSEFVIRFPMVKRVNHEDESFMNSLSAQQAIKKVPKILSIEDEIIHQKYIYHILKNDYQVSFASTGMMGLEMASVEKYDLLIMDISLAQGFNGIEALDQIREVDGYEQVPVIAATANVMRDHKERFLERGFTHYLSKPYKVDEMKVLVDSLLKVD